MRTIGPAVLSFIGLRIQGDLGDLTCYRDKRGQLISFLSTKPKMPQTAAQRTQRQTLSAAADLWRGLDTAAQATWTAAASKARLRITGYNLWCYTIMKGDPTIAQTVAHQSGITLDPDPATLS